MNFNSVKGIMEGEFACYVDYLWFHEELSTVRMGSNIKRKNWD